MANMTNLGGHSGCRILLCEGNSNLFFVRKISGSKKYNERLKKQMKKQEEFKNDIVKTPKILDCGMTKDALFYFDMEYIQGITLAEYMKSIEAGRIRKLVEIIVRSITTVDVSGDMKESVFKEKIESLKERRSEYNNIIVEQALDILQAHSWEQFKKTPCHGDLTLQNIIVKDNQLYFIDFLDSFYDCWLMDAGTLMQDVQSLWSYRTQDEIDTNTLIRLIIFRDILIDEIRAIDEKDIMELYYALLLKLIRIYPYVKDTKTYEFLNRKVASTLDIIKRGEIRL